MSNTYSDLIYTTYPDTLDTFTLKSNITNATDSALIQQIQSYIASGNFSAAANILNNNLYLKDKMFNSNDYNKVRDALIALQRFYNDDIETYVESKQSEFNTTVDTFSFKGTYSPSTQYYKNNLVNYTTVNGTFLYLCINNPAIGVLPTNTSYWIIFTIQGARGATGVGMSFTFLYNPTHEYSINDVVLYGDKWWGALQTSTGQVPYEGSTYWQVVLTSLPAIQIPITETEPTNAIIGDLWFKVI